MALEDITQESELNTGDVVRRKLDGYLFEIQSWNEENQVYILQFVDEIKNHLGQPHTTTIELINNYQKVIEEAD